MKDYFFFFGRGAGRSKEERQSPRVQDLALLFRSEAPRNADCS